MTVAGWIGPWELLLLLVIVLLVFGPKRLPEMGRSLGKGMREFKNSITEHTDSLTRHIDGDDGLQGELAAGDEADAGFCAACGKASVPGDSYCSGCGAPLEQNVAVHD